MEKSKTRAQHFAEVFDPLARGMFSFLLISEKAFPNCLQILTQKKISRRKSPTRRIVMQRVTMI